MIMMSGGGGGGKRDKREIIQSESGDDDEYTIPDRETFNRRHLKGKAKTYSDDKIIEAIKEIAKDLNDEVIDLMCKNIDQLLQEDGLSESRQYKRDGLLELKKVLLEFKNDMDHPLVYLNSGKMSMVQFRTNLTHYKKTLKIIIVNIEDIEYMDNSKSNLFDLKELKELETKANKLTVMFKAANVIKLRKRLPNEFDAYCFRKGVFIIIPKSAFKNKKKI